MAILPFVCSHTFAVFFFITPRIRRMGEGNIFSLCVSSHLDRVGGGVPHPRFGQGMYPIPGVDEGGGVSYPRSGLVGVPIPGLDSGVPHSRTGWGAPLPGLDGVLPLARTGLNRTELNRSGWGKPPPPH